jgi:capsular polysaccharide biosynthesis protein
MAVISWIISQLCRCPFVVIKVTVDNSRDPRISDCMACQVALYSRTNVLVGLHGAGQRLFCTAPADLNRRSDCICLALAVGCSGLTNMIFMPPGSLVVEITGQFDGRTMPLCGYHGGLAAVFGLHHYVYYYDWKGGERLDAAQVAAEAAQFWRFLSK